MGGVKSLHVRLTREIYTFLFDSIDAILCSVGTLLSHIIYGEVCRVRECDNPT